MSDTASILYALQIMAKENKSHFKTIKKAIFRTKKIADATKTCIDTQPASTSRDTKFEEAMLKAQTNTETMIGYLMEGMTNLHAGQEKHSMKHKHFRLKERVDFSYLKLDLVNENVTTTGENMLRSL